MRAGEKRRAIAGLVTVAGVVLIWAWSTVRQGEQTEALSRQWVGEQWDIARTCVTSTPFEADVESVADALEAGVYRTLAEVGAEEAVPDADRLWPGRCAPLFSRLHVDASVTDGDASGAVSTLEVLLPRVLRLDDVRGSVERARELATAIATLDEAMPPGAEYDPDNHPSPDEAAFHLPIARSLGCEHTPPPLRPFLHATLGEDRLYDELGQRRLVGGESGVRWITPSEGEAAIDAPGLVFPRILDDERTAWLVEGEPAFRIRTDRGFGEPIGLPGSAPTAFAPCVAGETTWLVLATDDDVRAYRLGADAASPIRPRPPASGVRWACGPTGLALVWSEGGTWNGSVCDETCRALPELAAGGDLQLAFEGETLAVVARGARVNLPLLRRLEGEEWSRPSPIPRGRLSAADGSLEVEACDDVVAIPPG